MVSRMEMKPAWIAGVLFANLAPPASTAFKTRERQAWIAGDRVNLVVLARMG
jgi:hypothetical protein